MIAVGIDVGGTSVKGATIRDNGEILDRFSMPMDKFASPEETIGKLTRQLTLINIMKRLLV